MICWEEISLQSSQQLKHFGRHLCHALLLSVLYTTLQGGALCSDQLSSCYTNLSQCNAQLGTCVLFNNTNATASVTTVLSMKSHENVLDSLLPAILQVFFVIIVGCVGQEGASSREFWPCPTWSYMWPNFWHKCFSWSRNLLTLLCTLHVWGQESEFSPPYFTA